MEKMYKIIKYTGKEDHSIYFCHTSIWANPWDLDFPKKNCLVQSFRESVYNHRQWLLGEDFIDFMQRERWLQLHNANLLSENIIIAADYIEYAESIMSIAKNKNVKIPECKDEWIIRQKKSTFSKKAEEISSTTQKVEISIKPLF